MDLVGFEPTTSSMPWKRAPNCATGPLEEEPAIRRRRAGADITILAYPLALVKPQRSPVVVQFNWHPEPRILRTFADG